ncbi:hypothetical protein CPB83DRAFT_863675 [Crepidotus variabilis]|uniref:Uncharacterized protein n=1 Tax=Crepidotus variabilis TaxID=179855 RepID=A0A9P6E5T0_9AGAR|nr:hypothetical protein CPB83DRAFT_863675 [Crepidotus variabilis]
MNSDRANDLGTKFHSIKEKLNILITTLLRMGLLGIIFRWDPDGHINNQIMTIYWNLCKIDGFSARKWWDLVDEESHGAIITFFRWHRIFKLHLWGK